MKVLVDTIPNGNGKLHLIPGLGHVPHMETQAKTLPPLVAFLKDGRRCEVTQAVTRPSEWRDR